VSVWQPLLPPPLFCFVSLLPRSLPLSFKYLLECPRSTVFWWWIQGVGFPLEWEFMSCSQCQELGHLAGLASDWLFTLVQPIRNQLACWQWLQLLNFHPCTFTWFSSLGVNWPSVETLVLLSSNRKGSLWQWGLYYNITHIFSTVCDATHIFFDSGRKKPAFWHIFF